MPSSIVKSFAEKTGKSVAEVEKKWNEIKDQLKKSGKSEDDPGFFQNLVGVLKKRLKIESKLSFKQFLELEYINGITKVGVSNTQNKTSINQ